MERGPLLAPSADLATGENRVDTGKSDNASEEAKVRRALKRARKKKKKHKKNQEGTKAALNANTMEEMECGPLLAPSADFVTGKNGVSAEKSDNAFEEAKVRRVLLYAKWTVHFESLNAEAREKYEVPPSTELPETKKKKQFISQLYNQVMRAFLVSRRNITSRLIDTAILIGATVVITVSSGLPELTRGLDPQVSFEELVLPTEDSLKGTMQQLFAYALTRQFEYVYQPLKHIFIFFWFVSQFVYLYKSFPLKVGIIMCVLIGLMATRILTDKKIEFFREASSGYNMNAYFVAVNIVATIEHSIQILCLTFFAAWLREPVAHWSSYFAHFLALGWICVSWSLFFPMIIPPDNVVVVTGFFMAFCGLLLSGAFPPTTWKVIYEGGIKELVSGWFSPTRYFFEALTVGEYRCLPPQSGWTVDDESVSFPRDATLMSAFGIAGHDPNATRPSCSGWYWGILPSIFVGLTVRYAAWLAMHTFHRAKQTKKPIIFEIKRDVRMCVVVFFLLVILVSLGVLTTWLFTRDLEPEYEELDFSALPIENLKKDGYGYVNEVLAATNTSSVFSLNSNSFTFPGN